jgi:hypothetical protein
VALEVTVDWPHWLKPIIDFVVANKETLKIVTGVVGGAATALATVFKLWPKVSKWWIKRRERMLLTKRLGAEVYTPEEILRATENYIEPDCQNIDPAGGEEFRLQRVVRESAFKQLDDLLFGQAENRHTIILADSGMGKTSLLLNYYARYARKGKGPYQIAIVPLGHHRADDLIDNIKDKPNTVLCLDAFDEDTRAIKDHRERLGDLLKRTEAFRHILITCRTQFFLSDEEIPRETGILRVGVTRAGEPKTYLFYKLYLSPFSDGQVRAYIRRIIPFWNRHERQTAQDICTRMRDLTARPMLLAHVRELLNIKPTYEYSIDLYEEMVQAWITREEPFIPDRRSLLAFSEELAIDIYSNRERRGTESIPPDELEPFAKAHDIALEGWQLTGRSLLNRTANGSRKFAHRSMMEYLFIRRLVRREPNFPKIGWTDQMARFLWDYVSASYKEGYHTKRFDLDKVDFDTLTRLRLPAIIEVEKRNQNDPLPPGPPLFRSVACSSDVTEMQTPNVSLLEFAFVRKLRSQLFGGPEEVTVFEDYTTRLVWLPIPVFHELHSIEIDAARRISDDLSRRLVGGYVGWALPSLVRLNSAVTLYDRLMEKLDFAGTCAVFANTGAVVMSTTNV